MKDDNIIYSGSGMPLTTRYAGKKVLCTFDTIPIRTLMEKIGEEKKMFMLPEGYYIEFVNTDRYSERPVVAKICKSETEQESQEDLINELIHETFGASLAGREKIAEKFTITRKP